MPSTISSLESRVQNLEQQQAFQESLGRLALNVLNEASNFPEPATPVDHPSGMSVFKSTENSSAHSTVISVARIAAYKQHHARSGGIGELIKPKDIIDHVTVPNKPLTDPEKKVGREVYLGPQTLADTLAERPLPTLDPATHKQERDEKELAKRINNIRALRKDQKSRSKMASDSGLHAPWRTRWAKFKASRVSQSQFRDGTIDAHTLEARKAERKTWSVRTPHTMKQIKLTAPDGTKIVVQDKQERLASIKMQRKTERKLRRLTKDAYYGATQPRRTRRVEKKLAKTRAQLAIARSTPGHP